MSRPDRNPGNIRWWWVDMIQSLDGHNHLTDRTFSDFCLKGRVWYPLFRAENHYTKLVRQRRFKVDLFPFKSSRSLEVQPPDRSAWRQHFTLGEIFKAYGHFQESIVHLRYALDLYPQYEPIQRALRDVENIPSSSLHVYTFLIIICLVSKCDEFLDNPKQ